MKTKILQRLKQDYSNLGVSEKAFDGVADFLSKTITEEERIPEVVANAGAFLKVYQSDVDKERTSAASARKELEALKKETQPKPTDPKPNDNQGNEPTEREKALLERMDALQSQLSQLVGQRSHEGKLAQITALLGEKKIPESFYSIALSGRTFGEDTNVDELVTAIEQGYTKFQDETANNRFNGSGKPEEGGQSNDDPMASLVKQVNEGTEAILNEKK
jgi:Sec-independent protein translocase protein TatA